MEITFEEVYEYFKEYFEKGRGKEKNKIHKFIVWKMLYAIRMQIPKMVKVNEYDLFACPTCRNTPKYYSEYCDKCGQALVWEEDND